MASDPDSNTDRPHPSIEESGPRWLFARFRRHSGELARLAGPVVISRTGILTLALVDTIMLGPLGAEEVGHYGLGTSAFVFLLVCGIGLLFGTVVETSHLRGEGRIGETGAVWRRALPHALVLGLIGLVITRFAEEYFLLTGQNPTLAAEAGRVTQIQGLGLLALTFYVCSNFYLEAMGRPLPGMIAVWVANIVNIPLNLWLIEGGMGLAGADGAAMATTLCRVAMAVGVMGYIWHVGGKRDWGVRARPNPGWIRGGGTMRRHGYAAGPAYAAESGAFHVLHIFAGWLVAAELAAFTVNMNLFSMIFMVSLGVANATAVRVGVAHGRRDRPDRALAGWSGCFWVVAFMALVTAVLVSDPDGVMAAIYRIDDPAVLAVLAPATVAMAFALTADGAQFTLANALRGADDAWIPTALNFVGFLGLMIPLSYLFAIGLERGARGLFEGIAVGAGIVFIVLAIRWTWVCLRRVEAD